MAIRPPSLVHVSAVPWSGDSALDLPDLHRYYDAASAKKKERADLNRSDISEAELADHIKKQEAEVEALRLKCADDLRKFEVSRETGDYSKIIKPGETPTWFHIRIIPGTLMRLLHGEMTTEAASGLALPSIALRIALVKIENMDGVSVSFRDEKPYGRIASTDVIDSLDACSASIVNEVGNFALSRSFPKNV